MQNFQIAVLCYLSRILSSWQEVQEGHENKWGDRMAIVQLENLTGQAEAVTFPRSFERIGGLMVADARLMIWGKIDKKDDRTQLIVEDAEPIEDV